MNFTEEQLQQFLASDQAKQIIENISKEVVTETTAKSLHDKKLENYAKSQLNQYGLSSDALEFVLADDEAAVTSRILTLNKLINKGIAEKQQQSLSYSHQQASSEKNPFSKEHLNLTEQGRLFKENPIKARQLAAQAGIDFPY